MTVDDRNRIRDSGRGTHAGSATAIMWFSGKNEGQSDVLSKALAM